MNIKKIAVAALIPAALTGITATGWAAVHAGAGHPGSQPQVHQARQLAAGKTRPGPRPAAHKSASPARTAPAGKGHAAQETTTQPRHRTHAKVHHRAHARATSGPATPAAPPSTASLLAGTSGFEQCVAMRESGDNPTASSAGLFGILPATWESLGYPGTAGEASITQQMAAFDRLYAQDGTQPWAPYDGC
jgi:Transglycosylase-like domain